MAISNVMICWVLNSQFSFNALYPLWQQNTKLNKIFSVTYYLDLHDAISFNSDVISTK